MKLNRIIQAIGNRKALLPVIIVVVLISLTTVGCRLFYPYYTLTLVVEDNAGGTVTADPDRNDYREDSMVELTAVPDKGWELKSWSGVADSDGNTASVLMNANRTVTADFGLDLIDDNPSDNYQNAPAVSFAPASGEAWTFMIYLDGDNNLDSYSVTDFNEMKAGVLVSENTNMNIIVLYDRWASGSGWSVSEDSEGGLDSGARLYKVNSTETIRLYPEYDTIVLPSGTETELNMGDPEVLSDFISYCATEHEADHYALILWNHGAGARSILSEEPVSRQICSDDDTGSGSGTDILYMNEVQQAIADAVAGVPISGGLDLVGVDACLMGTVEVAYELRNLTYVYAASMNSEGAAGWDYEDLFGRMKDDQTGTSAEELGKLIVSSFKDTADTSITPTMSAVSTEHMEYLKDSIDSLAVAFYSADSQAVVEDIRDEAVDFFDDDWASDAISNPYHDLNDICWYVINNEEYLTAGTTAAAEDVLYELGRSVICAYAGSGLGNYYGLGTDVERGLSIFFSKGDEEYDNYPHYAYQYWYTDIALADLYTTYDEDDGNLDFCTSDTDGTVETWREMHEVWYDDYSSDGYTPGSW
ncbi:MAG: clostripain-related cysteine peptidase [Spirochaetales bacterium]|uniref:Clostripain-related cysteine peptidase n=1 Tax=Candidatus Thalassospirochaeta sargassi TaxID=3119039 RepID=A0AAJ1MIJ5_9SPIO|nr:clostripain-related cysteine peptidase [Spirochaetales bacterium]